LFLFNKNGKIDPKTQSAEWVINNTKKISIDEINNFVQLADEEVPDGDIADARIQTKDKNDIQELIKDIPEKDIQNFLDETQANEAGTDDDVLMN
jgi:hypothetical protein